MAIAIHDFTYKESIYDRPACYLLRKEFREQAKAAIKALARELPTAEQIREPTGVYYDELNDAEVMGLMYDKLKEFGDDNN